MTIKSRVMSALPQTFEQGLRRFFGRPVHAPEVQGEKSAEWYDRAFEEADDYSAHYSKSSYYSSWTVIIDRIRQAGSKSILEIACGPGQLACALRETGLLDAYTGFDFAEKRVAAARRVCPEFRFEVADAFVTTLFDDVPYDTVISTEFLEHITDDIGVIRRIKPGTRLIGTVPNYPYTSHVRHFRDVAEVAERYAAHFDDFTIAPLVRNEAGKILFILEGIKRIDRI